MMLMAWPSLHTRLPGHAGDGKGEDKQNASDYTDAKHHLAQKGNAHGSYHKSISAPPPQETSRLQSYGAFFLDFPNDNS